MMTERYRGDLPDATLDDVIDKAGEGWDCREIPRGYVAVPREPGGSRSLASSALPGCCLRSSGEWRADRDPEQ
jgi:hypothetical protein